jgi:hypothetical protein
MNRHKALRAGLLLPARHNLPPGTMRIAIAKRGFGNA